MLAECSNPKSAHHWLPLVVFLGWALVFVHGFHQTRTVSDFLKTTDPMAEGAESESDQADPLFTSDQIWLQKFIQAPVIVHAVLKLLELDWFQSTPLFIRLHSLLL